MRYFLRDPDPQRDKDLKGFFNAWKKHRGLYFRYTRTKYDGVLIGFRLFGKSIVITITDMRFE